MTYTIAESAAPIYCGRRGENGVRAVIFPLAEWEKQFGKGTPILLVKRCGDDAPYPAELSVTQTDAAWVLSSADTANAGYGSVQLQYLVKKQLAKSEIFRFYIEDSLGEAGEAPQPGQSYLDSVLAAGESAKESAAAAQQSEEKAAKHADSIRNLQASASSCAPEQDASVDRSILADGALSLHFNIPRGETFTPEHPTEEELDSVFI